MFSIMALGMREKHVSGAPWRNFYGRRLGKTLRPVQRKDLDEMAKLSPGPVDWDVNPDRTPLDMARFGGKLTQADHRARVEFLLWTNQRTAASNLKQLLTPDYRKLVDARIALAGRSRNVDALVNAVPENLQDNPGLLYDRARWRRAHGNQDGAIPLLTAIADAVTEETIRRIYDEQIRLIPLGEEVRARHILVQTEEEAIAIKALIDQGRDFAELAVAMSEDQATRLEGGDLGYFSREGILPAFGAVAFATPRGEVSQPFRTEFGWHVLTVVDRRRQPPPSLEALRPNIARFYTFDQLEALIEGLREEAEIERPDLTPLLAPTPERGEEGGVAVGDDDSPDPDEPR